MSSKLFCVFLTAAASLKLLQADAVKRRDSVNVPCTKIPPGFDKLMLGVDITKLDLTPIESGHDQGFRNALFDETCNQNQWWTDTLVSNEVYQLPDAISMAYVDSRGFLDASSNTYLSYFDYRMQETKSWTVSWSSGWFHLSKHTDSFTYNHYETIQQNFSQYFTRVHAEVSAQVGQLHPYWSLPINNDVQEYVESTLPEDYATNPSAYDDFIQQYGTHYIDTGSLGGIFTSTFSYSEFFRNQTDESYTTKNSENSFFFFAHSSGAVVNHDLTVDVLFKNNTNFTLTYYGGNPQLITDRNFSSWWSTVPQTPYLTHVKLGELWNLLYKTPAKQENLKKATVDYGDRCALRDLQKGLQNFMDTNLPGSDQEQALKLMTSVQQLLGTLKPNLIDHDVVARLGSDVQCLLQLKMKN